MTSAGDPFANLDHVLAFTLPGRHARGRLVRLGPVLDTILANHQYPPVLARLLAEALVLAALLGSTLKEMDDQLTLQAHSQGGVVDLLVCDYRAGALRGYVRHDAEKVARMPATPSLFGIVPLEGGSLAEAAESYFSQSEQIPSLVRLAVVDHGAAGHSAGGIMIQHLPEGEEGRERLHTRLDHPEWEHVAALAGTLSEDELVDPALPLDTIRCSAAHIRDVILRFPAEERTAMAEEDGIIRVDCAFCARIFPVSLDSLGR
jgi:molecular chaperone Hsp33